MATKVQTTRLYVILLIQEELIVVANARDFFKVIKKSGLVIATKYTAQKITLNPEFTYIFVTVQRAKSYEKWSAIVC